LFLKEVVDGRVKSGHDVGIKVLNQKKLVMAGFIPAIHVFL